MLDQCDAGSFAHDTGTAGARRCSVSLVEVVVPVEAAFKAGQCVHEDVEGVAGGVKAGALFLAGRSEQGTVWGWLGMEDLGVDLPGDVAFEAADNFLGALAFFAPSGDVGLRPSIAAHSDQHDVVDGLVGCVNRAGSVPKF